MVQQISSGCRASHQLPSPGPTSHSAREAGGDSSLSDGSKRPYEQQEDAPTQPLPHLSNSSGAGATGAGSAPAAKRPRPSPTAAAAAVAAPACCKLCNLGDDPATTAVYGQLLGFVYKKGREHSVHFQCAQVRATHWEPCSFCCSRLRNLQPHVPLVDSCTASGATA